MDLQSGKVQPQVAKCLKEQARIGEMAKAYPCRCCVVAIHVPEPDLAKTPVGMCDDVRLITARIFQEGSNRPQFAAPLQDPQASGLHYHQGIVEDQLGS